MTDLSAEFKALADYRPTHKVRFVTAASLFDGHDAAINIMRRILQGMGAEVIHLGHNRSVDEIVTAALQEDVQGIAISSYQGGHVEFFKYMVDLLRQRGGRVGEVVAEELEAELVVALHARMSALHGGIVGLGSVAVAVRRSASFRHCGVFRERGGRGRRARSIERALAPRDLAARGGFLRGAKQDVTALAAAADARTVARRSGPRAR
jgi:methylmalonyl-CoA mutase cobalamin-binding domain/chain